MLVLGICTSVLSTLCLGETWCVAYPRFVVLKSTVMDVLWGNNTARLSQAHHRSEHSRASSWSTLIFVA